MERPLTEYRWLRQLTELPFVDAIWLYGSRARGYAAERSDVDLAIVCPRADWRDWDSVRQIIEEADTLLAIDCVRYDGLPEGSELRASIDRTHVTLFERRPGMTEHELGPGRAAAAARQCARSLRGGPGA